MNIVLIGSGRISRVLGHAFRKAGHNILMVHGRNPVTSDQLAVELNATSGKISDIPSETELILVAVSDDSINDISELLPDAQCVVAHCSGSRTLEELGDKHMYRGVFYPLDSFSPDSDPDLKDTPLLIEGDSDKTTGLLHELASSVSDIVIRMNSSQREQIHVAAVFYNNFINHIANKLRQRLTGYAIDEQVFKKLIGTTVVNIMENGSHNKQTGPAARKDMKTIEKHLEMLKGDKTLYDIYSIITNDILKQQENNDQNHK